MLVDGFEKLADHKGYRLDAFDLFLRTDVLTLEVCMLVFNVFLLDREVLEVPSQLFILDVQVLFLQLVV
jgi:hypothetical protein